ncbi:MAG: class I SAM-dependent methyltransferase [Actinomycetaceae bacterium]|nr:class I SAM-dependent methyltransferase [Actinomycetaceae bacterium]
MSSVPASPLPVLNAALLGALAADLELAGWRVDRVEELIGPRAAQALMREERTPALVALKDNTDPASLLTRLFMLGDAIPANALGEALPTLGLDGLCDLGLVSNEGDSIRALFDLRPHSATLPSPVRSSDEGGAQEVAHHWWIMSDLAESVTGAPLQPDHVLGIGGATTSLLRMTMRAQVSSSLDLGCGCGIQALYLATHSRRVIATDISERACVFTAINAALNGVENIEILCGSLYEPVEGMTFDLITSNPPFVITPQAIRERGFMEYRDGGMERDHLVATVIRQAPTYLRDGGKLQILGNWEISSGVDPHREWHARVEQWLEGLPLKSWVVQRDILDPAQYAELWLRDSGGVFTPRSVFECDYAEWLADFERANVEWIGMGFLVAEKIDEAGAPLSIFDNVHNGRFPLGADVERTMNVLQFPDDIEDFALVRCGDVTEERHYTPGQPNPEVMILHQGGAMGQSIRVGTAVSALVGASDGDITVGQFISAYAMLAEEEIGEVRTQVMSALPELLRSGMLYLPYALQ